MGSATDGSARWPAAVRPAPSPLLPGSVAQLLLHYYSMTTSVFGSEKVAPAGTR